MRAMTIAAAAAASVMAMTGVAAAADEGADAGGKDQRVYFIIHDAVKLDTGGYEFKGQLVAPSSVEVQASKAPKPKKPKYKPKLPDFPREVKYILPMFCKDPQTPEQKELCARLKGAAEDVGFDTTFPDDFSYPGR